MTATTMEIAPILRRTPTGWLAVTAPGDHPRIAVQADTEHAALESYRASRLAWLKMHSRPMPEADPDA